jgi:hypothetical protein
VPVILHAIHPHEEAPSEVALFAAASLAFIVTQANILFAEPLEG